MDISSSPGSSDPEKAVVRIGEVDGVKMDLLPEGTGPDGAPCRILTEDGGYAHLGFKFSDGKKWAILTSVFIVQISMNFNAAIYANAVPGMKSQYVWLNLHVI